MTEEAYIREFRHMAVKYGETLAAFDKAFKMACLMWEIGSHDTETLRQQMRAVIDTGLFAPNAIKEIIAKQEICLMREGLDARKKYQSWFAKCYDRLMEVSKALDKIQITTKKSYYDHLWLFRNAVNGALEAEAILQELLEKELLKKKGGADGVDRA
jgi:histone deacetylase complex regulatory component SIN3